MLNIIISLLTFVLILISLFLVLVILMQRANSNAGMGSAFGGGVTESAFGAETTNILTRATKWSGIAFFIIALALYLLYMSREGALSKPVEDVLPIIAVPQESVPAGDDLAELFRQAQAQAEAAQAETPAPEAPAADSETEVAFPPVQ